jgi:hypothetical protein
MDSGLWRTGGEMVPYFHSSRTVRDGSSSLVPLILIRIELLSKSYFLTERLDVWD